VAWRGCALRPRSMPVSWANLDSLRRLGTPRLRWKDAWRMLQGRTPPGDLRDRPPRPPGRSVRRFIDFVALEHWAWGGGIRTGRGRGRWGGNRGTGAIAGAPGWWRHRPRAYLFRPAEWKLCWGDPLGRARKLGWDAPPPTLDGAGLAEMVFEADRMQDARQGSHASAVKVFTVVGSIGESHHRLCLRSWRRPREPTMRLTLRTLINRTTASFCGPGHRGHGGGVHLLPGPCCQGSLRAMS